MASRYLSLAPLLGAFLLLGLGTAQAGATAHPAHYLVLEMDQDGRIDPVFHRFVELAAPPRSKSDTELLAAQTRDDPRKSQVVLQLLSKDGRVVFQDLLQIPQSVRGEFHGKKRSGSGWEIDSHRVPLPLTSFVVRVPRIETTPVGGDVVEFTDSTLVLGAGEMVGYLAVPVASGGIVGAPGRGKLPGPATGDFSRGIVDPATLSSCAP